MQPDTVASVPQGLRPTFEAVQAAPAAIAILAPTIFGYTFSDVAALLGCGFLLLQMGYLVWRWRRDIRRDKRREEAQDSVP